MYQKKAFNVNCGRIDNIMVDSGGHTNYYLHHSSHKSICLKGSG